jgi:long-subunit acyl-CoA synthetase (AMP-forming)
MSESDAPVRRESLLQRIAGAPCAPERQIVIYGQGQRLRMSLGDLDRLASQAAAYLQGAGLREGDRIGIIAQNGLGWIVVDLAALKLKAVTAGFEAGRIAPSPGLLERYSLKLLFTDQALDQAAGETTGIYTIAELLDIVGKTGAPVPPFRPNYGPGDVTTIKFTSGSTGEPKGLAATAGSIDSSIRAVQSLFEHGGEDAVFVFLPLSLLQQRYWIYSALAFGHDVVVSTYELAFLALAREQPTVVMGVPGFFETLRANIEQRAAAAGPDEAGALSAAARAVLGSRIRYLWTGSAPAGSGVLEFFERCGMPIFEGYGMNETCIVTKNTPDANRRGSVGRPLPEKRVSLDDDGVIIVHSDFPVNAAYLYAGPGESERVFRPDGSVYTGDLGEIDEEGYLYVRGRIDDIVSLGNGRNVLVRPIENRLKECRSILECIVTRSVTGLEAIVCVADAAAEEAAVAAHAAKVNGQIPVDERIESVVLIEERFTPENGLATSQFKPRRREIVERCRELPRSAVEAA